MIMAMLGATAQAFRTAGQKYITAEAGRIGASFMRFLYAIPFSCLWLFYWHYESDIALPATTSHFWFWVVSASLLQIGFTICLVVLLQLRNFAAGTAFSKTEVLQAAIFEAILVGYIASFSIALAIGVGIVAVLLLGARSGELALPDLLKQIGSKAGVVGLLSGSFLGCATVCYGIASRQLETDDAILRASITAAIATLVQTSFMIPLMGIWARGQLIAAFRLWRAGLFIGIFSSLSTITWFVAFALHYVGPARAIGQIELVISILISALFFKERISRTEYIAIMLLCLSMVIILLG